MQFERKQYELDTAPVTHEIIAMPVCYAADIQRDV